MATKSKQILNLCSTLKRICTTVEDLNELFLVNWCNLPLDDITCNDDMLTKLDVAVRFDATVAKQVLEQIIQIKTAKDKEHLQEVEKFIGELSSLEAEIKEMEMNS